MADSKKDDDQTNLSPTVAVTKAVDPLALRQALEVLRPTYTSLTEAQLLPIRIDPPSAAMQVLNQLDEIEPYREKIVLLPFVNQTLVNNLEPAALALLEVYSQNQVAVKLPPGVMETYREATGLRDELRDEAIILERRGLIPKGSLATVSGDRGYRNTAVELTALGNVLRDSWEKIAGKCAITPEEVDRCSVLAQLLFRNADDRLQRATVPGHLALLKQQAYTLLMLAYDEVHRCIEFLDKPALERVVPTLFQGRGRKPASAIVEEPLPTPPAAPAAGPEETDESRILQELSGSPTASVAPTSSADPVTRAEALQAASATAKPSKNPFAG
jgi:hypothetical protein